MKDYVMLDFAAVKITKKTEYDLSKITQQDMFNLIMSIKGTSNFELWYELLLRINLRLVIGQITIEEAVELGKMLAIAAKGEKLMENIVYYWRNKPENLFSHYHEIVDNINHYFCSKFLKDNENKFWGKKMFEILNENTIKTFSINNKNVYITEYTSKVRKNLLLDYISHNIDEIKNGRRYVNFSCLERYNTFIQDHDENGLYKVLLRCWNNEKLKDQEKEKISQEEKMEMTKKIIGNIKREKAKKIFLPDNQNNTK